MKFCVSDKQSPQFGAAILLTCVCELLWVQTDVFIQEQSSILGE